MSRRSERLKQFRKDVLPTPDSDAESSPEPEPSRVIRKTARKIKQTAQKLRRRGKLYMMLDMPLDVILEVSCCLSRHPRLGVNL
jgi:hypothetical protein